MRTIVITPAAPLMTAIQARAFLRYASDDQDALIEGFIAAATEYIERVSGVSFGLQTLELRTDDFCDDIILERGPIVSVTSLKYLDADNDEQTLSGDVYTLVNDKVVLAGGESWPTLYDIEEAVRVRYVAGYSKVVADEVVQADPPATFTAALQILVADMFRNRETTAYGAPAVVPILTTAERLISSFRRVMV